MNYPITPGVPCPAVTIRAVATSSSHTHATTIQITTHPTTSPHCTRGKQGHLNTTGGLTPKLRIVVKAPKDNLNMLFEFECSKRLFLQKQVACACDIQYNIAELTFV